MKYLKTFENINLKKYVIIEVPWLTGEKNFMSILEIVDFTDNLYHIKFHYSYIYRKNRIEKDDDYINEYDADFFKNRKIVLQSDSLDECLEYLNFTKEVNKYNL